MKVTKQISIVIGIRDWDTERLEIAIRSHTECSIGSEVEVVVSDYGSSNASEVKEICARYDCVYRYTDAEIWSRSRALNVGFVAASTDLLLTSDADIIFAPDTIKTTKEYLLNNPNSVVLAQCSDLSKEFSLDQVKNMNWSDIYDNGVLRPRWGMGGLCAFNRETLDAVHGFDERMVVWGAEDNDFVKRCRQAGRYLHWIEGSEVGIYHVWHPPFVRTDPKTADNYSENRRILFEEFTTARNYLGDVCYSTGKPLVSINIASYNRGHLIGDVIRSVLNQTVQDFELIIYDDGSKDETEEVVSSFKDPRIRFIVGDENRGVAFARNKMVTESLGEFICVHDDDDIMLPNRLEIQLNAMTDGVAGNFGGWVDYDADDGELSRRPGKMPFGIPTVAFIGSALAHGTLMVKTDVMKRLGYETSFRGGSDYNLAFRLANAGYKLKHCGDYLILRRIHSASLTSQSSDVQKLSSRVTTAPFLNNISSQVEKLLREESKSVNVVNIDPVYDDTALIKFLPNDIFINLIEISEERKGKLEPMISIYQSSPIAREFAIVSDDWLQSESLKSSGSSEYHRVAKNAFNESEDESVEVRLKKICEVVRDSSLYADSGNAVVLECEKIDQTRVQSAVEKYLHLTNSIAMVNFHGRYYTIVGSPDLEVANLAAYSIRAAVGFEHTHNQADIIAECMSESRAS